MGEQEQKQERRGAPKPKWPGGAIFLNDQAVRQFREWVADEGDTRDKNKHSEVNPRFLAGLFDYFDDRTEALRAERDAALQGDEIQQTTRGISLLLQVPRLIDEREVQRIEAERTAIDPNPWRLTVEEGDEWVIWFHADLQRDPRRIIVSLDAEEPSRNERAAGHFLLYCREYVRDLAATLRVAWRERLRIQAKYELLIQAMDMALGERVVDEKLEMLTKMREGAERADG